MTAEGKLLGSANVSSYQNNLAKGSHDSVIPLQRTICNQEAQRMLVRSSAGFDFAIIGIQPKLKVSQPGDEYEQEADRVAEQVMRMSDSSNYAGPMTTTTGEDQVSRKCSACEMKKDKEDEKLELSRKPTTASNFESIDETANEIKRFRYSGGSSLDPSTRGFMEPRFGYDLRNVRIHTDERASISAESVNALAYTIGNHIVFGEGQYQPDTMNGRRLLAHELTHVIQQSTSVQLHSLNAPPMNRFSNEKKTTNRETSTRDCFACEMIRGGRKSV